MSGATAQLALFGQEDLVLSGSPQITFWRLQYQRPSIFSMESIQQTFQGEADFGRRVVCQVTRSGDLMHTVFVEVDLPDLRNFSMNGPISLTPDAPAIVSARWIDRTSANIRILPSTDGLDVEYSVNVMDTVNRNKASVIRMEDVDFRIKPVDLVVEGIDYEQSSNIEVTVNRVDAAGGVGPDSNLSPISSLKWTNNVGHALIRHVDLEIGGARINRLTSEWMDAELELTTPLDKLDGLNQMLGRFDDFNLLDPAKSTHGGQKLYIPLTFSFCRTPGVAIPLLAMQFHGVHLNFDFRDWNELVKSDVPVHSLIDVTNRAPRCIILPYVTFVYLGSQERQKMANQPLEYLIQDIQFLGDVPIVFDGEEPALQRRIQIDYAHPVSEIVWTYNASKTYNSALSPSMYAVEGNDYFNYEAPAVVGGPDTEPVESGLIFINGNRRFSERSGSYFRLVQPFQHHTRTPYKKVYCYSFALSPEDATPSGSLNFTRVDTAHLALTFPETFAEQRISGRIRSYARSWNILKVANGMGGLLFASS